MKLLSHLKWSVRSQHKWIGLICCFFLTIFSVTGILLNHRSLIAGVNVSRRFLPSQYHYSNWNNGIMRGTTKCILPDSTQKILIYGNAGIYLTDSLTSSITDHNNGIPEGADYRQIKRVVQMPNGEIYAAGMFGVYKTSNNVDSKNYAWKEISIDLDGEKITDADSHGDSLVVMSRSEVFVALPPYNKFEKIQLKAPKGYTNEVTLFRTMWLLHSGEIFGTVGKIIMDIIAVILIILSITGFRFFMLPKKIKRLRKQGKDTKKAVNTMKQQFKLHNIIGKKTIILTVFIAFTGWCLRPPMMVLLALNKTKPIPGSSLDSDNPWHDKLRAIRFDKQHGDWLVSTSEGFVTFANLKATPKQLQVSAPVSVMGINVMEQGKSGLWRIGSFSGMFIWNRDNNLATDYFTGNVCKSKGGAPFGQKAVTGYTADFKKEYVADYGNGCDFTKMPDELQYKPMSLWSFAFELHNGRMYGIGAISSMLFIFVIGILAFWVLWSGWKIRKK